MSRIDGGKTGCVSSIQPFSAQTPFSAISLRLGPANGQSGRRLSLGLAFRLLGLLRSLEFRMMATVLFRTVFVSQTSCVS